MSTMGASDDSRMAADVLPQKKARIDAEVLCLEAGIQGSIWCC